MPFALDWEAIVELACLAELFDKRTPDFTTFPTACESTSIPDYD